MRTALPKALNIQGLSKTYRMPGGKPVPAVENFNLDLTPGEFVTLLGPSGCGKTTVLRTLAGLEDLDGGEILLDGRSIARQPWENWVHACRDSFPEDSSSALPWRARLS